MVFHEGDRVILISHFYGCRDTNPVWGSDHACVGTIDDLMGTNNVMVEWDNGCTNSYDTKHLDRYNGVEKVQDSNNPNRAFRLERARKERSKRKGGMTVWDSIPLPK